MRYLIILLTLNLATSAQRLEDGWKGIRPLSSAKDYVERVLGKPIVDDNGYHRYETDDTLIIVNYARCPCSNELFGRGKYRVPTGTVLNYIVGLKKEVRLSDIGFDREKYYRDTSGDVKRIVGYGYADKGINIEVILRNGEELVQKIRFHPATGEAEKFICK